MQCCGAQVRLQLDLSKPARSSQLSISTTLRGRSGSLPIMGGFIAYGDRLARLSDNVAAALACKVLTFAGAQHYKLDTLQETVFSMCCQSQCSL